MKNGEHMCSPLLCTEQIHSDEQRLRYLDDTRYNNIYFNVFNNNCDEEVGINDS
jgi:hypothetical protein